MKKLLYLLLAALLCAGLTACAPQQSDTTLNGEAGNYYDDLTSEAGEDSFTVTATAHIEDELTIVHLLNPTDAPIYVYTELQMADGSNDPVLYHKQPNGEMSALGGASRIPYTSQGSFPVPPGESSLVWLSEENATAEFTLTLSSLGGVEVSCFDADFADLPEITDGDCQQLSQLEVYAADGTLLNTVTDADTLAQFSRLCGEEITEEAYGEQAELQSAVADKEVLYTFIAYKEPAAVINDGQPEKLIEMTVYADAAVIKEVFAPSAIDAAPLLEEYLTFYLNLPDADHAFLLSLAENC